MDADGQLSGFDEPVDGAEIDLEVVEDLVGGQKGFVPHHPPTFYPANDIAMDESLSGDWRRRVGGWLPRAPDT